MVFASLLLVVSLGYAAKQYSDNYRAATNALFERSEDLAHALDQVLRGTHETIDGLRIAAEDKLQYADAVSSSYARFLDAVPGRNGYGLSGLTEPSDHKAHLNLTGLGDPKASTALENELKAALALEPMFKWVKSKYPASPWVYYLSQQRFMAVYPYIPFDDFFMDDSFFDLDLFAFGLPGNNPDRETYVTNVYEDEAGKGLMVTIGAPVYADDAFKGIVGFDLLLSGIGASIIDRLHPGDDVILLNANEDVLFSTEDREDASQVGMKPKRQSVGRDITGVVRRDDGKHEVITSNGTNYIVWDLENAPWRLIVSRPQRAMAADSVTKMFPFLMYLCVLFAGLVFYLREREHQGQRRMTRELREQVDNRTHDLKIARDKAESANRAKTEFLSSMSHELRTPMNAIVGFSQVLERRKDLPEKSQKSVREIRKAGDHLMALINELLDLAQVESGRIKLASEPVSVRSMIEECICLVTPLAAADNVSLSNAIADEIEVSADRRRLKQALLNLLSNAIKYNRRDGDVRVDLRYDQDGMAVICVSDTCGKIPDDKRETIFAPFSRLQMENKEIEGTGIGLSYTRQVIEMMGGEVGIADDPNGGNTFWIKLPVVAVGDGFGAAGQNSSPTTVGLPPQQKVATGD